MKSKKLFSRTGIAIALLALFVAGGCRRTDTLKLTHIQTVNVTQGGTLNQGAFARIGFVPGRDRMVITFNSRLDVPAEGCTIKDAYAFKEYTPDMIETGSGIIICNVMSDTGGLFVGNDFYFANMAPDPANDPALPLQDKTGWRLMKYDAVTWTKLVDTFFPLMSGTAPNDPGVEDPADPMIAYVNGLIDVSSTFRTQEQMLTWGPLASGGTHHQFFTPDLIFVGKRFLSDPPHINLSSMVETGGIINFVTGTALLGDLVSMQYDSNWNLLQQKRLKEKSAAPEGLAFDGQRFYVSYLDVPCTELDGCFMNVRLGVYDSAWNLLEDIAVTDFVPADLKQPGRPSLTLHNGRIYVVYDQNENTDMSVNPETSDVRVYVAVYAVSGS
jgi:hypothetical protein